MFYADGACEANYWFEFSAARQTMSPRLTPAENERLFGAAATVHGHNYRARLTFRKDKAGGPIVQQQAIDACVDSLRQEVDHRHLNEDVPRLKDRPITTESLAAYIRERVAASVPIHRVRLHERADFFAEAWTGGHMVLGMQMRFSAGHRLHVTAFSHANNEALMGEWDNAAGQGNIYL